MHDGLSKRVPLLQQQLAIMYIHARSSAWYDCPLPTQELSKLQGYAITATA